MLQCRPRLILFGDIDARADVLDDLTGPQILTSIGAIDAWVRTGVRPTAASFPVPLGFNPTFVPPPF